jgi:hypothetical protein
MGLTVEWPTLDFELLKQTAFYLNALRTTRREIRRDV